MQNEVVHVSSRGQITLPKATREALSLKPGDVMTVQIEAGRVILDPAVVVPLELYTPERIQEFDNAAGMTPELRQQARKKWSLG